MIADGLTKILPVNTWPQFLKQLGLINVKERLSIEEANFEDITAKFEALDI